MGVEHTTEGSVGTRMVAVNGTELCVEERGSGPDTVVFSPALFTNKELFDAPFEALSADHRCIRYDHRGHGDSGLGDPQPLEALGVEGLYEDALALLDELGVDRCHWVGASLGGFVGLRLAAHRPERIRSLVLIGLSTRQLSAAERRRVGLLTGMVRASRWLGPVAGVVRRYVATRAMAELLGRTFMTDPSRGADRRRWREHFMRTVVPEATPMLDVLFGDAGNPPQLLARVGVPTLVVSGEDELAALYAQGEDDPLEATRIMADARMAAIPRAGHMVLVEQPGFGTDAITDFIDEVESR